MGGMMALHWAAKAPEGLDRVIVVNPIGLEDWQALGVPYRGFQEWYEKELDKSFEGIESYQKESYYDGQWNEEFARWATLLARPTLSPDYPTLANVQAQTYAMIASEPIAHRWDEIDLPVTLIIGERDRTALGKDLVSPALRETLGRYDRLGKEVASALENGELIPLPGLGHLPHIEDFPRFKEALKQALRK
jgi:pimeloyl-ACP methyl ester carboxylesterase